MRKEIVAFLIVLTVFTSGCITVEEEKEEQSENHEKEEWQPEYGIKYEVHITDVLDGDTFDAIFPD